MLVSEIKHIVNIVFLEPLVMKGEISFLATRNKTSYVENKKQRASRGSDLSKKKKNRVTVHLRELSTFIDTKIPILGDPGATSRDDGILMGESLQQERESPWALTLTERVPEAFEIPPSDWPEKFFSGQSAKRNSRATLVSSYTRLFSSSIAVVAWPVQREHF